MEIPLTITTTVSNIKEVVLAKANSSHRNEVISIKFTVYGKPQGKARPRFTCQGWAYTPKQTADYERQIKQAYISAGGKLISDTAPILICITAEFKKAKSNKMQAPTLKPDTDNIAKVVCDALNGIAYKDDKQIISLQVLKVWTNDVEKVEVEVNGSSTA